MSQTATRDERRSALDDFAAVGASQSVGELVPMAGGQAPAQMVYGAQQLAVHRDEAKVLQKVRVLAAAAGDDWYYRFPVKNRKENRTDWIEGPSIKLANDIARLYGNCEVDCRAQDLGQVILFHARFVDLETGYALTRPFQQRKGASKMGGADDQRREDITFQIGASKAIRNVVVNALQTFADFAFEEAKQALVDKVGNDIDKWRNRAVERVGAHVDIKRVEAVIGRPVKDWLAPDVARVIAMGKAVSDGMATWDESFPPLGPVEEILDAQKQQAELVAGALDKVSAPHGGEAAAGTATTIPSGPKPAAAPKDDRAEIVTKLVRYASDPKVDEETKLQNIEQMQVDLLDRYEPPYGDFVKAACKTAAQVATGQLDAKQATDYLTGLIKGA